MNMFSAINRARTFLNAFVDKSYRTKNMTDADFKKLMSQISGHSTTLSQTIFNLSKYADTIEFNSKNWVSMYIFENDLKSLYSIYEQYGTSLTIVRS